MNVKGPQQLSTGSTSHLCTVCPTIISVWHQRVNVTALLFTFVSSNDWCLWAVTSLKAVCHPEGRNFTQLHLNRIVVTHFEGLWSKTTYQTQLFGWFYEATMSVGRLTISSVMWNSLWKLNGLADFGTTAASMSSPYTTILREECRNWEWIDESGRNRQNRLN